MTPLADFLPGFGAYERPAMVGLALAAVALVYRFFFTIRYPANLPRVGGGGFLLPFSLRTYWTYYTDCATLYRDAFENYSKEGKTVLVPGFGTRCEVIMPPSSMRWLLSQPERILSLGEALIEVDQVEYSLGHGRYLADPWQGDLVKTELNLVLENVCDAMNDELKHAFDTYFGTDSKDWKEIDLLSTVRMIIGQAASRFTVGLPLCRNEEYIKLNYEIIETAVLTGLTGAFPKLMRPAIGRLISWSSASNIRKMEKIFEPVYRERLATLAYAKGDPNHPEPADHLQLMMRYAAKERPEELRDLHIMTRRLFTLNFGSFHQTALQTTNMILNILGSDAEHNTIAVLRDEVSRIIGAGVDAGRWTKAMVAQMTRADSVARETLRLNAFGNRAVFRKVVSADGVVTQDGIRLPRGALISFLGHPAQTEAARFEDPLRYDPFRFSRARESGADGGQTAAGLAFVSTSPTHLPFGHGKHACPGRFLVDFELKMIIAYVLMNYDIAFPAEYGGKRPPNVWVTEACFPPPNARIRIRRREKSAA
ncbi:cytochrome P450 [Xylariomycetidae sp. FL2044]|nr:cytochrome P450 [Xylariomycetidae sp. FL2044]